MERIKGIYEEIMADFPPKLNENHKTTHSGNQMNPKQKKHKGNYATVNYK